MISAQPKRSRRTRAIRVAMALSVAFIALLAATWFFIVPAIVQQRIDDLIRVYEPNRREFRIHSIGLTEATIADVRLGDQPWLETNRVVVRYGISDLLRGRIDGIEIHDATWRIAIRDGEVDWGLTPPPRRDSGPIALPFDATALRDATIIIDLDGERLAVPLTVSTSTDAFGHLFGRFESSGVTFANRTFPAIAGDLDFDGTEFVAMTNWPLIESVPLTAGVALNLGEAQVSGLFTVKQPAFALADASSMLAMIPAMNGIEAGGQVAVNAEIRFAEGKSNPLITLRAGDITLAHPEWPLAIASASGVVTFDSLSPLKTQGPQRIRIASATTGELEIRSGELLVDLTSPDALRINSARWFMSDGGTYSASPATIDLTQPRIVTRISGENIGLDYWLRLFTSDRADGSGRLRGEFDVDWNPRAKPRIQFTGGSLVATPPTGFIRVHDAPMLGEMLDQSDPRFTVDQTLQTVKQRIIEALTDLGFTRLSFDFIPDGRDTTLRANLEGQGRRGEHAQQFSGLVVNIGHFAQTLQDVLNSSSAKDGLSELLMKPRRSLVPQVGMPQAVGP